MAYQRTRSLLFSSSSTTTTFPPPPPSRIAVIGGGIAGTLCSLVLKNRGLHPVLVDAGTNGNGNGIGGRLRNGGAQFLRATDPRLATVAHLLAQQGLLRPWTGRFGVLGSSGGGFLPASIVTLQPGGRSNKKGNGIAGMQQANHDDNRDGTTTPTTANVAAFDAGDFVILSVVAIKNMYPPLLEYPP